MPDRGTVPCDWTGIVRLIASQRASKAHLISVRLVPGAAPAWAASAARPGLRLGLQPAGPGCLLWAGCLPW